MKVAVIGTGPSVELFNGEADFTIGVNDTWRKVHTRALVCLDQPRVFTPDRMKAINESKPERFYSQIVKWDTRADFYQITLNPGFPDRHVDLHLPGYYKSFCSPFVAAQIAYRVYDATEIHLYGVDLINHPHLKGDIITKIQLHFRNLGAALEKEGCRIIVHGKGALTQLF